MIPKFVLHLIFDIFYPKEVLFIIHLLMPFRSGPLLAVHDFCPCHAEGRKYGGFHKILNDIS